MNRPFALALGTVLFALPALLACSGDSSGPVEPEPDPNAVASVSVSVNSSSIYVGQTTQCMVTTRNASGHTVSTTVTWSSSNATVATVDQAGVVTGVAEGSAVIRASAGGVSGTGQVTVMGVPVASVSVTPASASIVEYETLQLTATALNEGDSTLLGRSIAWSTTDASVAAVDTTGLVTGLTAGSATITATIEGKAGSSSITVEAAPVVSVVVSPDSASVILGRSRQFTAQALDANGRSLTGRTFIWSTGDTTVATVDGHGLVTGKKVGSTTVTAVSGGKDGSTTVTVLPVPVASVTVDPETVEVPESRTVQLTATARDSAENVLEGRSMTWLSSDEAVATVDQDGLVSGVSPGSATITATSEGVSGTAAVTVTRVPVHTVIVTPTSPSVVEGNTLSLTATTYDDAGAVLTGRAITWSSANASVATVDANGLVTGVSIGQTIITATSEGISGSATVSVVGSLSVDWDSFSGQLLWSYRSTGGVLAGGTTYQYIEVTAGAADVTMTATRDGAGGTVATTHPVQQGRRYRVALDVGFSGQTRRSGTCATFRFASPQASGTTTSKLRSIYHPPAGWWEVGYDWCPTSYTLNTLTVENAVERVNVSPSSATIQVGRTRQLTATGVDADGATLSRYTTWESSNESVATVDDSGVVTGVTPGTVTITASSEGRIGTSRVTVTPAG